MSNFSEASAGIKNQFVTVEMPADVRRRFLSEDSPLFIFTDNLEELKRILRDAFKVRIIALLIIFLCTPSWSIGFLSPKAYTFMPDDIRYEAGAMQYAKTASSIVDREAFKLAYIQYGDRKGYETNWFTATPLWYWIVCITIYITRTNLTVRLLNITLACFGIKYLYLLAELLFDKKTALLASKLYAFLPYPVAFSCFAYKDHLMFLGTAYLLYVSFLYRYQRRLSKRRILPIILSAFCCASLRSGLTFALIFMCLFIAFSTYLKRKRALFSIGVALVLCLLFARGFVIDSLNSLIYKASFYQTDRQSFIAENRGISIATISGAKDFYKLPITFLVAVSMPLKVNFKFQSWSDLISLPSMAVMPAVAVGAFLDIFLKKHQDALAKLALLLYYLLCAVTSISYARHYYSLLFIPIAMCAHYVSHASRSEKFIHLALAVSYSGLLFLYLLYRTILK